MKRKSEGRKYNKKSEGEGERERVYENRGGKEGERRDVAAGRSVASEVLYIEKKGRSEG